MSKLSKDDAELFVQIFKTMRNDEDCKKAMWWVHEAPEDQSYEDFKAKNPIGSEGYRNFITHGIYAEVIGTLVNKGLLSEDLVFETFGDFSWKKLKAIAQGMRKDWNRPRLWENHEIFAHKLIKWDENNPPKI